MDMASGQNCPWSTAWSRPDAEEDEISRPAFASHALADWGMEKTQAALGHAPMFEVTRADCARAVEHGSRKC